jgi:predicted transcriptional regulator
VLKDLEDRRLTAPEVRGVLGSSREHAARMMKSLADRGLVIRDSTKRPYSYEISDVGRDVVAAQGSKP